MPIQKERKLFPLVFPQPPEKEEDLLQWAQTMALSYKESVQQIYDKFNSHIYGTHAHPKAWANMRIRRPRYYSTGNGTSIIFEGDVTVPMRFVIDGELFELTSDLTCDLSGSGPGGLDTGSVAADKPYYLYAVKNAGTIAIIASLTDPASGGPSGYASWSYVGACSTREGSAVFTPFRADNGLYLAEEEIDSQSQTSVSRDPFTFDSIPVTARVTYWQLIVAGAAGSNGYMCASDHGYDGISQTVQNASYSNFTHGWLPIFTPHTIYIAASTGATSVNAQYQGFIESPTEYP